jgi:hypothetical protein
MSFAVAQPTQTLSTLTLRSASPAAAHASTISTGAVAIAVLAGLVALGCLAWGLARLFAFEPRWAQNMRHSIAEAGVRTSATFAELGDWIRLGR